MLAQARHRLRDVAALALLFGGALVACGFLLRNDLLIYGDHPGQFLRLWYPLRESGRLLSWNPLWYAGYPELQFYPPGYVIAGLLLDWLTLHLLSPFALYQALLFLAYLLPGISAYLLVRVVTGSAWMGLVAGTLALVFAELWGGATAVFVGLVGERLAFGLVPLAMLAGWQALHVARPLLWWLLTALSLVAVVLVHPFHAVAPGLFLGVAALCQARRWRALGALCLACLLALALGAFWLLPLAARAEYAAPMLRADLLQTLDWLFGPNVRPYFLLALLAPLAWRLDRRREIATFIVAVAAMGAGLLALILVDHLLLIDQLEFYALDPVRFAAEFYLAVLLLAALGLSALPLALARVLRPVGGVLGGLLVIVALALLLPPLLSLLRDQRDPAHFLAQAQQEWDLDAGWQVLASDPGRILFTSNYMHLDDVPTSLKAATPYFTGRSILGGTFSHWSPVARALWTGTTEVDLLPGQVELLDDVSLAGRPWEEWTDLEFYDLCRRLNATTVAATWQDSRARTFLDAAPHFESFYSDDLLVLYRVLELEPTLVEVTGTADVTLVNDAPLAIDLQVSGAAAGDELLVKITDYPLWRAEAAGQRLTHGADPLGLMVLSLPPGSYDLHLRYVPELPERLGGWISLAALVLGAGLLLAAVLRRFPARGG